MSFINARLDDSIEQGSQGGPMFLTTILALSGGGEKRNQEWQYPRMVWNISFGVMDADDPEAALRTVKAQFMVCGGKANGFRFKDWSDYVIGVKDTGAPQAIGVGDGVNLIFQAFKSYAVTGVDGSTVYSMLRPVTRLVKTTLKVYVNSVLKAETSDYTVNYDTGVITFVVAPGSTVPVAIYTEFDIPVRFDSDVMNLNLIWEGAGSIPPINVIELREYGA